MTDFPPGAPTSAAGPDGRPLSPHPPARPQPLTPTELDAARTAWRELQDQIAAALDADNLTESIRLSQRCRELDRIVCSQPLSFITGGHP